jgi:hypothetical protein
MMLLWCLAFHGVLLTESLLSTQPSASLHGGEEEEEPYVEDDELDGTSFQEDFKASPLSQRMARDQQCDGCDFTIDFSCPYTGARAAYYHRIADCLLPSYGLLDLARAANGSVCILTYPAKPNLMALLPILTTDMRNARIIDSTVHCASALPRHAVDPGPVRTKLRSYLKAFPSLPNVVGRHPIDFGANVRKLHRDISRVATPPKEPQLVLIDRPTGQRRFASETRASVSDMLNRVGRTHVQKSQAALRVVEYSGQESIKSTFEMFTNAAGVIGYHGAGFANALFTARPSCIMELTTWYDLESTRPWRTNRFLIRESPYLFWYTLHIKLQTLLDANPNATFKFDKVKELSIIKLSESDVVTLEKNLVHCLGSHAFPVG